MQDKKKSALINHRSAFVGVIVIVCVIVVGMIAFSLIEGRDLFHSLYYVAITLSTIGYGDITPITHAGKVLTTIYALVGVPLFVYVAGLIIEARMRGFVLHHLSIHQTQMDDIKATHKRHDHAIKTLSKAQQALGDEENI